MKTESNKRNVRDWGSLDKDILVKIFMMLNVMDIIRVIPYVCDKWLEACYVKDLWEETIDLTNLRSPEFGVPSEPYSWAGAEAMGRLEKIILEVTRLTGQTVKNLYFNFFVFVCEEDLALAAERLPNIRKLALPPWNSLSENSFEFACGIWRNLQTLIIPSFRDPKSDLRVIGNNCRNLVNLKLMSPFTVELAKYILKYLPNLKSLSLRCSIVYKEAVYQMLLQSTRLKRLNLSHCKFRDIPVVNNTVRFYKQPNRTLVRIGARVLDKFLVCSDDDCATCQRLFPDETISPEFNYKEEFWRDDELEEFDF